MNYTIARHFPELSPGDALGLFDAVTARQARLIAQWMGVGFVHGVMNTDNMALSGETIDYGPCAFMEAYAPGTVFSSIDRQGRYAYANQPLILGWNLARLAEALLPFFDADSGRAVDIANERLEAIAGIYQAEWLTVMRGKLALEGADSADAALIEALLREMAGQGADWTLTFRRLAAVCATDAGKISFLSDEFATQGWDAHWRSRLRPNAAAALLVANPAVIPRNHKVEEALEAATRGDLDPFQALLSAITDPFASEAGREAFALPAPQGFGDYVTFCGT